MSDDSYSYTGDSSDPATVAGLDQHHAEAVEALRAAGDTAWLFAHIKDNGRLAVFSAVPEHDGDCECRKVFLSTLARTLIDVLEEEA